MSYRDDIEGDEVLKIVESDEKRLCVIAGPGTGKSFAFKKRIQRLIEEGKDPKRMLAVTFSRTAALDIKNELSTLCEGTENIKTTTLHSFCFSILNKEGVFEITGKKTRILLDYEKRFMLEDFKSKKLGDIRSLDEQLKAFEAAWARLQTDEPGWTKTEDENHFKKELESWLEFHDAMILEEIVPETLKYLRENPISQVIDDYDYIFVDEYQDLNKAEQTLIDLLSSNETNIMIIGDDDQSIYSFRHAHPEGIAEYVTNNSNDYIPLDKCRRCPESVIEIANTLIKNNTIRYFNKTLQPLSSTIQGDINIVQWDTLDNEIEGLVDFISENINNGNVEPGEILVLAPSRHIGYQIRDLLVYKKNVNAHSFFSEQELKGNPKILEKCENQRAFTLLTLLVDPEDKVALRCWLGYLSQNLRSPSYSNLLEYSYQHDESPLNSLEQFSAGVININHTSSLLDPFDNLKQELNKLKLLKGPDLINELFPESKLWAKPFRSFIEDVEDDLSAEDILNELKTNITQPELPTDVDYVRIMSLYKSKGLTAKYVIVCSCVDRLVPFTKPGLRGDERIKHIDEQRRLFYVGITRPKEVLVISTFRKLPDDLAHQIMFTRGLRRVGRNLQTRSSPFISELGSKAPRPVRGLDWAK